MINCSCYLLNPLFSTNFLETFAGLATIRAFGWVDFNLALSNHLLDMSQRPVYLLAMIQQWLTTILSFVVAVIAIALVTLATQLSYSAGFTSIGLISLMSFGNMLMNIVSRLKSHIEYRLKSSRCECGHS